MWLYFFSLFQFKKETFEFAVNLVQSEKEKNGMQTGKKKSEEKEIRRKIQCGKGEEGGRGNEKKNLPSPFCTFMVIVP